MAGSQWASAHSSISDWRNAAACADAVALAHDLKHGNAMSGWDWTGWFVATVDHHRYKVDEVPIANA
jgi:hypothetical protein